MKLHEEFMNVVNLLIEKKIEENQNIELIILGGSVARGDETEHSDIDINFYVKKDEIPKFPRKFYEFKGKFIEEIFIPIENFNSDDLIEESKILYDKNSITNNIQIIKSDKEKNNIFLTEWEKAKKYLNLAQKNYENRRYEKSIYYLLGSQSMIFTLTHTLPPKFNLSFPSFRLFNSIKKISEILNESKVYDISIKHFEIEDINTKKTLMLYEKAYRLMSKCYQNRFPKEENLGFYDDLKITYNIEGLKLTFQNFTPGFALGFIIGTLIDWCFALDDIWDLDENKVYRDEIKEITKEIFKINDFNQDFVKEKLLLSTKLKKIIEEKIIKDIRNN